MAGIYIHIPFCKSRCIYCDFFSGTQLNRREELLSALRHELSTRASFIGEPAHTPIDTLYFGGGTPSLLSAQELKSLITHIRRIWPLTPLQEVTVEANPDDLTPAYLESLLEIGINRLSVGIQSFHDKDLQWMHRRHDSQSAIRAVEEARRAGFTNLSLDLIYGLPQMSLEEWNDNLTQALALHPEHLSAYHLTIEPSSRLGRMVAQGTFQECPPEMSEAHFNTLHQRLTAAGYEHYEVSNFAQPGYRARHNSSYWNGTPYLGIGPAAHSFNGSQRCWNVAHLLRYLTQEPLGTQSEGEQLTSEMQYDEYVMTRLRTSDGLTTKELESGFGARKLHYFESNAARFLANGTLVRTPTTEGYRYAIPADHFLISDSIISDFFVTNGN